MYKNIRIFTIFNIIMIAISSNISAQSYTMKMHSDCYLLYGEKYQVEIFDIENISDNNIWIFFESDKYMTNNDMIRKRFKSRQQGEMSLYQWMTDGNVNWGEVCPNLYGMFFKVLPPKEKFYIIIFDEKLKQSIVSDLRIIDYDEMSKIFKPLIAIPSDTPPSYQSNFIVIP